MAVTIEQAAKNALASWLSARMPAGVVVLPRWPTPDQDLPERAVSIIWAGARRDLPIQPEVEAEEIIHDAVTGTIGTAAAVDLATANALLNASKASYEAHRVDVAAHQAADTTNTVTAPDAGPTDLAAGIALATNLLAVIPVHMNATVPHGTADTKSAPTSAIPTTLPTLINAAEAIRRALHQHYAARVYLWRVAACEQPIQLDVWAQYDAVRDDMIAALEPLLNPAPSESAGYPGDEPVGNGILVELGDGWPGLADFQFTGPQRMDTPDAVKRSEYRAMYRGSLEVFLLVRAQSPRIARITLRQHINDATAAVATIATSPSGEPTEAYS